MVTIYYLNPHKKSNHVRSFSLQLPLTFRHYISSSLFTIPKTFVTLYQDLKEIVGPFATIILSRSFHEMVKIMIVQEIEVNIKRQR